MSQRNLLFGCASVFVIASMAMGAGQPVSIQKVDESTVTGTLVGLENGQIILSSPDAKIPLEDLVTVENKGGGGASRPAVVVNPARKLTGKVIGLEGSWNEEGSTREKAFDGDLETFFDAPEGHMDDAWVGLDLGGPKIVTEIKFAPRGGQALFQQRMVGGRFQGSNTADFGAGVEDLFTISNAPPADKLTSKSISVGNLVRYESELTPGQGNGYCAEIEFWGKAATMR